MRLISWAGSEIEPYGVDYILQRLGFSHARYLFMYVIAKMIEYC